MAVRAIVLAAGAGTRMKSDLPKVLHEIAGRPLVGWVLAALEKVDPTDVTVVVGSGAHEVRAALPDHVGSVLQEEQLGTGHAARVALSALDIDDDDAILLLPGDTPLLTVDTIAELLATHRRTGAGATVLTACVDDPAGYGRILRDGWEKVTRIVEHKDATTSQREINEINGGVYVFAAGPLAEALSQMTRNNVQGEYYLTDALEMIAAGGHTLAAVKTTESELAGVNSQDQLASAAAVLRARINAGWMRSGVWMQDPARTYIDAAVDVEPGARIYADVYLEGTTRVGAHAEVGPDVFARDTLIESGAKVWYAVMREASVGPDTEVGPYVSLRPGARLERSSKAGTFVEMKNTVVGEGAKVPHLAYMGDAEIGAGANVGAGTITCNYDGFEKHRTVIGEDAFIGSDTMLVAPVEIGAGAFTGAGSTISKDVSPGALAVERSNQREIPDYAEQRRRRNEAASPKEH
ncbi:MAG: bifunctional UDP-N-acetylglucosamine diphosphorylase/glucosamine-1-phosphate N-acetyltransferase GlmU [Acidimicrobiia bacterium]|nr:bifunctional UDP-N-acetylglucosamine diphosphorylase/glucosamine-1-phosphate N-acetyltransferase GlmU [Acidimicrobiia bacterium]